MLQQYLPAVLVLPAVREMQISWLKIQIEFLSNWAMQVSQPTSLIVSWSN